MKKNKKLQDTQKLDWPIYIDQIGLASTNYGKKQTILSKKLFFIVFIPLVFFVYFKVYSNGFVGLDKKVFNITIGMEEDLPQLSSEMQWDVFINQMKNAFEYSEDELYLPIKEVIQILMTKYYKDNPDYYHFTSVLLHLLLSIALFYVLVNSLRNTRIAGLAVLIFVLHPLATQVVCYASELFLLFALVFGMLSWLMFLKASQQKKVHTLQSLLLMILSLFFLILGLLTYPISLIFPILFLWSAHYRHLLYSLDKPGFSLNKGIKNNIKSCLIAIKRTIQEDYLYLSIGLLIFAGYLIVVFILLPTIDLAPNLHPDKNRGFLLGFTYLMTNQLGFIPYGLSADYSEYWYHFQSNFTFLNGLGVAISLILILLSFLCLSRSFDLFKGWILLVLLVLPSGFMLPTEYYDESLSYAPLMAIGLVIAAAFNFLLTQIETKSAEESKPKKVLIIYLIFIGLIGYYVYKTVDRSYDWESNYSLWSDILETQPDHAKALAEIGRINIEQNKLEYAIELLQQSRQSNPLLYESALYLGEAYLANGQYEESADNFKKALQIKPDGFESLYGLGKVYLKLYQVENAIEVLEKLLDIAPDWSESYFLLGVAYNAANQHIEAIDKLRTGMTLSPTDYRFYKAIGKVYTDLSDFATAEIYFRQWADLMANDPQAHYSLGLSLFQQEKYIAAKPSLERAVDLDPEHTHALYLLERLKDHLPQ